MTASVLQVGLLCLATAMEGGDSNVTSSTTVFNEARGPSSPQSLVPRASAQDPPLPAASLPYSPMTRLAPPAYNATPCGTHCKQVAKRRPDLVPVLLSDFYNDRKGEARLTLFRLWPSGLSSSSCRFCILLRLGLGAQSSKPR